MAISIRCKCGVEIIVGAESQETEIKCFRCKSINRLSKGEVDPRTARYARTAWCSTCGGMKSGPLARCASCHPQPTPDAILAVPPRPPKVESAPVAWEVWVVMAMLGVGLLGNSIALLTGQGNIFSILLAGVMMIGLYGRTNWGWWLTTILSTLAVPLCLLFAWVADAGKIPGMPADAGILFVATALFYAVIVGLMASCRLRGTYARRNWS